MSTRVLNLLLLVSSLFGYLEWGLENSSFLYQSEWNIIKTLFSNPKSISHPFIVLPMLGQLLLLITLFQKKPNKVLSLSGIFSLSFLLLFISLIGAISLNLKIFLSTLPFLIIAVISVRKLLKKEKKASN